MSLWILRPVVDWVPWTDSANGFVVRADSESDAREMAQRYSVDALYGETRRRNPDHSFFEVSAWTDPDKTSCVRLLDDGDPGVVMEDFSGS